MNKPDALYTAAASFITVYVLSYVAVIYSKLPLLRYYPLQHTWSWTPIPNSPGMAWYCIQTYALIAAVIAATLVSAVFTVRPHMAASRGFCKISGLVAIASTLAAIAFTFCHEFCK